MTDHKYSFPPVVDAETRILVLGSLPGVRSLAAEQYYAHPQNRFWRVTAAVFGEETPDGYAERLAMLARHGVGLWDVLRSAVRPGSLDSNISAGIPNDIPALFGRLPALGTAVFNGKTAARVFDRHFRRDDFPAVRFIDLPSTSPANASFSLERLTRCWRSALAPDKD